MRSEFEKMPEISEILNDEKSHFNGDFYVLPFNSCAESFINGAWYAFQHQQSKIDDLQKRVDAVNGLIEDLNKCHQQDHQNKFEYWRGFAGSAGILGKRLEQALKGGMESKPSDKNKPA